MLKSNSRPRYTLNSSIQSGQSKVEGKVIRCANKGITEIGKFDQSSSIEKLFISTNLITSLKGIEDFTVLKILSISYNEIQSISEIKYLKGLRYLETINMEGNPITQLPYYQQHVFAAVPTLKIFDGKNVPEKLKNNADQIVKYDIERLKLLCANEMKIQELEDISKFSGQKNQNWIQLVQQSLKTRDFDSYNFSVDEQNEKFDRMREVALELKTKESGTSLSKWNQIYDQIESVQNQVLTELENNLTSLMKQYNHSISVDQKNTTSTNSNRKKTPVSRPSENQIKSTPRSVIKNQTKAVTDKNKTATPRENVIKQMTPPTHDHNVIQPLPEEATRSLFDSEYISKMNDTSSSSDSIMENMTENGMTLSPSPQSAIPQQYSESKQFDIEYILSFYYSKRVLSQTFQKWKSLFIKIHNLNRLCTLYTKQKEFDIRQQTYQKWCRSLRNRRNQRRSNLHISSTIGKHIPYKPVNLPHEANIELLEKAQSMAEEISKLQADYEKAERKSNDIHRALEESVKNEEKMKTIVRKLTKENNALTERLAKSQTKYEEDVVQFILESRFKYDQQEQKLAEIKKINQQKELELSALKKYIAESKVRHNSEINELKQKLTSAFDVASGFRLEISRLKNESLKDSSTTPVRNISRPSSNESSPDTDDTVRSHHRPRRSEVGVTLKNYDL
ncbi:hypothetical protein TRFO_33056 [Tritrichomonas foetus]|uniref:Leucine Rich Repeat family protein n=1 Tax=Tritrichomonas foetus TaxID=1144522 RepID=A0A1J4JNI7_9EUKA|nr:hypothetical protein TRFO_33056 [Tritrichomonas foetus]|eukprot:OHT00274.1 hypothetical protein TRFO_33056 [Tritrichomonas foetus]